jgi:hypothetical protein
VVKMVNNRRAGPHAKPTGAARLAECSRGLGARLWLWRKPLNGNRVGHWREPT